MQERKIYLSLLKIIILPSFPFPSQTSLPNIPFGIIRLSACNYEVCYVLSGDNLAKIWFHLAAAWNILINPFNSYQINQHWIFFFPWHFWGGFLCAEISKTNSCWWFVDMKKLLDFGRKALFYVRVLSGYEERRIRSYRLQLEQRVQQV